MQNLLNCFDQKKQELPISNIRQQGTIIAFEVNGSSNNYISNIKEYLQRIHEKRRLPPPFLAIRFILVPPYCISNAELHSVYAVIIDILSGDQKATGTSTSASDPIRMTIVIISIETVRQLSTGASVFSEHRRFRYVFIFYLIVAKRTPLF